MELVMMTILFVASFFGAFIGATVGGAGLVLIPVLILSGMSPLVAIATSKVGMLGLNLVGLYEFDRAGKIDYHVAFPIAGVLIVGSFIGAKLVLGINQDLLKNILIIMIIVLLLLVLFKKNIGTKHQNSSKRKKWIGIIGFFFVGLLDAFLGIGGGILAGYLLLIFFGETFLESAGTKKLALLGSTIIALIIFSSEGIVEWNVGIGLFFTMMLGASIGSRVGLERGNRWVRHLFLLVVVASVGKMLIG